MSDFEPTKQQLNLNDWQDLYMSTLPRSSVVLASIMPNGRLFQSEFFSGKNGCLNASQFAQTQSNFKLLLALVQPSYIYIYIYVCVYNISFQTFNGFSICRHCMVGTINQNGIRRIPIVFLRSYFIELCCTSSMTFNLFTFFLYFCSIVIFCSMLQTNNAILYF